MSGPWFSGLAERLGDYADGLGGDDPTELAREAAQALDAIGPAANESHIILRSVGESMEREGVSSPALRERIRDAAEGLSRAANSHEGPA